MTAARTFRLGPQLYPLSKSRCHDLIGLEEDDDGVWSVYICHLRQTRVDLRTGTLSRG